jgi:uroporphyrinogen-III decarboxylase
VLSVDAMVSGRKLREELSGTIRVGNVDAELLRRGPPDAIARVAQRAAEDFHIVCPACGLVPSTPPAHLRALTGAVCGRT